mgnify:CR=1 FL=1
MNAKIIAIILLSVVVAVMLVAWVAVRQSVPSKFDDFARCLKEKGAVFYGAFWCPHCNDQKKLFGTAKRLLPYVECSTPDGKSQRAVCAEKNIAGYPEWHFADGAKENGLVSLARLAEKTGCILPAEE